MVALAQAALGAVQGGQVPADPPAIELSNLAVEPYRPVMTREALADVRDGRD